MKIRPATEADWEACWAIIQPIFAAGDTYPYSPDMPVSEAKAMWFENPEATFVAEDENGTILGTYYLRKNQAGRGSHVCNCGYMVSPAARGKGLASMMCEHSQKEAVRLGFSAMQFNLVVASNEVAVRLWQKLGFKIVGELPKVFNHAELGLTNAYVMFKQLA